MSSSPPRSDTRESAGRESSRGRRRDTGMLTPLPVNLVVRNERFREVPAAETRSRRDDARTGSASELPGKESHQQRQHLEREWRSQRADTPAHSFGVGARPIGYAGEVQRELIVRTPDGRL